MMVVRTRRELDAALPAGPCTALVPTMGALHAGHVALLRAARAAASRVVMSLFVNPTQFAPGEDLARYPRDEEADLAAARAEGVDVVFAPSEREMYPDGFSTTVDPGPLGGILEGAHRPGHFAGVATVVTTLLALVRPDLAFFGEKDWQQLVVVRHVVRDLGLGVEIRGVPTVREPDGLALSSRNRFLENGRRAEARTLSAGLLAAESLYAEGERRAEPLLAAARASMAVEPQYLALRERDTLVPFDPARPAVLAVAARVGPTRLIDNVLLVPPVPSPSGASS
jgi:pantoate--beta-alanine ligase